MSDIKPLYPLPSAYLAPYIDALGTETPIEFLLNFGGAEIYLSTDPKGIRQGVAACAQGFQAREKHQVLNS